MLGSFVFGSSVKIYWLSFGVLIKFFKGFPIFVDIVFLKHKHLALNIYKNTPGMYI